MNISNLTVTIWWHRFVTCEPGMPPGGYPETAPPDYRCKLLMFISPPPMKSLAQVTNSGRVHFLDNGAERGGGCDDLEVIVGAVADQRLADG